MKRSTLAVLLLLIAILVPSGLKAEGKANLSPPHADEPIDANSDGLYNYLKVTVNINVSVSGWFGVEVQLYDSLELTQITIASGWYSLNNGMYQIPLLLSGPEIYNNQIDGPYHVKILLYDESKAILDTGLHRTKTYKYLDFQPYDARFLLPVNDSCVDLDNDRLCEYLGIEATIDVATPSTYKLVGYLSNASYALSLVSSNTSQLGPGKTSLRLFFDGLDIYLAKANGPYVLALHLYGPSNILADYTIFTTKVYYWSDFEGPPVKFNPPHFDRGVDIDLDGLYDYIELNLTINVSSSGKFTFKALLSAKAGSSVITGASNQFQLSIRDKYVEIDLPSFDIYSSGVDGPYFVDLEIRDSEFRKLDSGNHTTFNYSHLKFEKRPIEIVGSGNERVTDINRNGLYEKLLVSFYVETNSPETYLISAVLMGGRTIISQVWQNKTLNLGLQTVDAVFLGRPIRTSEINGKYFIRLTIFDANFNLFAMSNYTTQPYNWTQFEEGAILNGTILDALLMKPFQGATIIVANYSFNFTLQTSSDSQGNFSLYLFPAQFFVTVDHQNYQSQLEVISLSKDVNKTFPLSPQNANGLYSQVTWSDWKTISYLRMRVFSKDSPTMRFVADWFYGDRNRMANESEIRQVIQKENEVSSPLVQGVTKDFLWVDNQTYVLDTATRIEQVRFSGFVTDTSPGWILEKGNFTSLQLNNSVGHLVAVNVTYDNAQRIGFVTLVFPQATKTLEVTAVEGIALIARWMPTVTIDPRSDPYLDDSIDFVHFRMYVS